MNFDADKKTISTLLNCKKEFKIPRFQREYSWEKPQLKEFFEDIISRISVDADGNLSTTEYFWGTTLFVGSWLFVQIVAGGGRTTAPDDDYDIFIVYPESVFENREYKACGNYAILRDVDGR